MQKDVHTHHAHLCKICNSEAADAFLIWIGENRNDEGGNQVGERNENMSHTKHTVTCTCTHTCIHKTQAQTFNGIELAQSIWDENNVT